MAARQGLATPRTRSAAAVGRELQLARFPTGAPAPGDFRVVERGLRAPRAGEVLVRNTWTSVDPSLILRMSPEGRPGYFSPFALGRPLDGIMTVGVVIDSQAEGFAPGDTVWHAHGWREYALVEAGAPALNGLGTLRRLDTDRAPAQTYLGALGPMGLTAYAGLVRAAELRAGDVVWVSAAAGAVGSLAGQFAKLRGHRVIGSAGSDAKVAHLVDELGLDAGFNYRSAPLDELLRRAAPDGIDVYFDNVGGEHLLAALAALRPEGRVALCGAVSEYLAAPGPARPAGLFDAVAKGLTLRGLRGSRNLDLLGEMQSQVASWMAQGRLHYRETVLDGLESAPEALRRMLTGASLGKTLVRLAGP